MRLARNVGRFYKEKLTVNKRQTKERQMKTREGILNIYEVFALPFGITVLGGIAYIYSIIIQAGTP